MVNNQLVAKIKFGFLKSQGSSSVTPTAKVRTKQRAFFVWKIYYKAGVL